ncbi:MAG TPA: hypothetical protein VM012_03065 [Flavitalea sp.]|nr:hypothetical protein [Flavitalea sp.]
MICEFEDKIFSSRGKDFENWALELFRFQYKNNQVYHDYVDAVHIQPEKVHTMERIPFLPIRFFKSHAIQTGSFDAELIFESSGTTGSTPSRHYVKKASLYKQSFLLAFEKFYGPVSDWCIIGLLPSYLERSNSSLILMTDELIKLSQHPSSGFYLKDHEKLHHTLISLETGVQKTLLLGVTFALIDFAVNHPMALRYTTVMETGGMKGRHKELTRGEVHKILQSAWQLPAIHSEFGMTELLSQAYSKGDGRFTCSSLMKVFIRLEDDPFEVSYGGSGAINIIDLSNIYSCAFIETEDLGIVHSSGDFEISGRMDATEARGCSLMLSEV